MERAEVHGDAMALMSKCARRTQPSLLEGVEAVAEVGVCVRIAVAELVAIVLVVKHKRKRHDVLPPRHLQQNECDDEKKKKNNYSPQQETKPSPE